MTGLRMTQEERFENRSELWEDRWWTWPEEGCPGIYPMFCEAFRVKESTREPRRPALRHGKRCKNPTGYWRGVIDKTGTLTVLWLCGEHATRIDYGGKVTTYDKRWWRHQKSKVLDTDRIPPSD